MMRFFRRDKSEDNTDDKSNAVQAEAASKISEAAPPEAPTSAISGSTSAPVAKSGESSKSIESTSAPASSSAPPPGEGSALSAEEQDRIREEVFDQTRTIFDPEIPVSIHALGLIYGVDVSEDGKVFVRMTLTAPNCPAAGSLPVEVKMKAQGVAGVTEAEVAVVWEPVWNKDMMSEEAKLELGFL